MAENDDQWLWFDDEENEQSPLQVVTGSTDGKTAATSAEVVKAVELHLAGKTDEALRELKRAIDIGKSLPEIYPVYGQICFELKKYDDAAAMFGNLSVGTPAQDRFYNQGVCLEKCGRYKEAAEAFRTAMDIDPDRKEARLGLGICLLRLGDAEKALEELSAYLPLRPNNETAQFGRGVALQMLGRVNESMDAYRKLAARNRTPPLSFEPDLGELIEQR